MAAAKPERVRSLCLYEPAGLFSVVTDSEQLAVIANERSGMAPVAEAVAKGELVAAAKQAAEWTEGIPGSFNSLPREVQQAVLENAHTLKRHFSAPLSKVTCADLHAIPVPVTLIWGADTRPFFAAFANAIGQCLVNAETIVLPGARHFAPVQRPDLFARLVLAHLERCGAAAT
jgi:pimeloyl-ACP methyl ester carboxylesterase